MTDLIVFFAAAALSGVLVKAVDEIEDALEPRLGKQCPLCRLKFPLAAAYGLLIGYVISFSAFSTLWLAVLFAQFIIGKIDKPSHFLGFAAALVFAVIFGAGGFQFGDFLIFVLAAIIDESSIISDRLAALRPALKIVTLFYGLFYRWDYFIAIMCFDLAYLASGFAIYKLSPQKEKAARKQEL